MSPFASVVTAGSDWSPVVNRLRLTSPPWAGSPPTLLPAASQRWPTIASPRELKVSLVSVHTTTYPPSFRAVISLWNCVRPWSVVLTCVRKFQSLGVVVICPPSLA